MMDNFIDSTNDFFDLLDKLSEKYLPYFLWFVAGFFSLAIWQIIARG